MKQLNHLFGGKSVKNDRHEVFNKKSKNARTLPELINNTKENIEQAEISMEFALPEELENLEEKNSRRRQSIHQMEEQLREKKARRNR